MRNRIVFLFKTLSSCTQNLIKIHRHIQDRPYCLEVLEHFNTTLNQIEEEREREKGGRRETCQKKTSIRKRTKEIS